MPEFLYQELYNRSAELVLTSLPDGANIAIKNLRVSFEIEKNSESNANTARISVYNLNKEHRDFIESSELHMSLFVGYLGINMTNKSLKNIFSGNVKKSMSEKSGSDFITILECGDGERNLQELHIDKTYDYVGGTPISTITKDLARSLNLTFNLENIKGLTNYRFKHPVVLSGNIKAHLENITRLQGLEFSVQNEEVHIRPVDYVDNVNFFILSKNTGLIGTPIKREIDLGSRKISKTPISLPAKKTKKKTSKEKKKTKFNGIEFTALLNPEISPTKTVKIESDSDGASSVNGFFSVKKAVYSGDTFEGDWTVRCEALQ